MSDPAAIIVAITGLLGALGALGKFLWGKVEARFAKVEAALDECKRREEHHKDSTAVFSTVITLLCQEVARLSPGKPNAVLRRAQGLLTALHATMPINEAIPPDMRALIDQLDEDLAA